MKIIFNKIKNIFKNKIIIAILIIILIAIGLLIFFMFSKKKINQKIMLFVNSDKELKYISNNMEKPITIAKVFDEDINAKYNSDRSYMLFIKNSNLYSIKIGTEDAIKIGQDVISYDYISDEVIYYLKKNKELYSYVNNKSKKLDINVTDIFYYKNNIIMYNKDNNIYSYNIKKDKKEIILKTKENIVLSNINKNLDKIYYIISKDDKKSLYIYDIVQKKERKLTDNLDEILDYDANFNNIIFSEKKEDKKVYDVILDDDLAISDKEEENKPYTCYFIESLQATDAYPSDPENNTYLIYHIDGSYYYFIQGRNNASDEFLSKCKKNPDSNSHTLRTNIRSKKDIIDFYDVFIYTNDKIDKLEENVNEISSAYANDKSVVYKKYNLSNEKPKISSIKNIEDYDNIVNNLKMNFKYKKNDKDSITIKEDGKNVASSHIMLRNSKLYYLVHNTTLKEDNEETIDIYELNKFNFDNKVNEVLEDSVDIFYDNIENYDFMYLKNYNPKTFIGDLELMTANESKSIDTDCFNIAQYKGKNIVSYYKDYDISKFNGSFIIKNIKTGKKIKVDDISFAETIGENDMFVFKDYSESSHSQSLIRFKNEKEIPIEYNVTYYKFSN